MSSVQSSSGQPMTPLPAPTDSEPLAAEPRETLGDTLREMLAEVICFRELLWQMTLRDLRIRYKQAVMGFGWALFMPLMVVGAGLMVKVVMQRAGGETAIGVNGFSGMAIKAIGWAFFVGAVGFAASSLTGNIGLITKIYFPREVFPLSAVITQVFDSALGSVILVVWLACSGLLAPSWSLVWVFPLSLALLMLTAGVAMFLSCANVFFRDVKYLVQIMLTFGVFFTPVFYDAELFGPQGAAALMLNPLAPLLEGLRLAIVERHDLFLPLVLKEVVVWEPWYLAYAAFWAVGGFFGAWVMFHRLEFIYPEYL